MTTQFDTLAYAARLEDAGVPSNQATAHAQALGEMMRKGVCQAELTASRMELIAKIDVANADLKIEIARLANDNKITRWMVATNLAIGIALFARSYVP